MFSTQVTRFNLYWTNVILAVTAGTAGILLAASREYAGGAAMATMDDQAPLVFTDFITAGLNDLPLVFFFTGLVALVLAWRPKMGNLVYLYLVYAPFINYFGNLVDFPEWFLNTAIPSWIPRVPVEDFDGKVFAGITAISLSMIIIGYIGYNRRDLIEEGQLVLDEKITVITKKDFSAASRREKSFFVYVYFLLFYASDYGQYDKNINISS